MAGTWDAGSRWRIGRGSVARGTKDESSRPRRRARGQLRRLDRPLFVFDKCRNPGARGQVIGEDQLDELVDRLGDDVATANRLLYLSWKGSDAPWLLIEDRETTESERAEMAAQGETR